MKAAYTFDYSGIEIALAADSLDEAQGKVAKLLALKGGDGVTLRKIVDLELTIAHQVITQNAAVSGGLSVSKPPAAAPAKVSDSEEGKDE